MRAKNWKAIRMPMITGKTELYDLATDIGETKDVAGEHPAVVKSLEHLMDKSHVPDPNWVPEPNPPKPANAKKASNTKVKGGRTQ